MNSDAEARKIKQEMKETLKSIQALGPFLEGSLKENAKTRYVKKDGSVSEYPTAPILQYRTGTKKRGYQRIPAAYMGEVLMGWNLSNITVLNSIVAESMEGLRVLSAIIID